MVPSAQIAGNYGGAVAFNNGANVFDGTFYGDFLGLSFIGGGFSGQFIGDGSGLGGLNASQLASGLVPDARLSAILARLTGTNVFTSTNTFAGMIIATNVNNVINGTFLGNGGGLTNLNTAQFANSVLTNGETGLTLGGTFSGNGAGLVNLNASQLSSGTVPLAQMPAGVVMNNASSTVLGDLSVNNLYLPSSASGLGTIYLGGNPVLQSYGFGNFFVGMYAGNLTMSGNYDTALGYNTLQNNTSGGYNTASGAQALKSNSSGGFNTADGAWALASNTNGSDNTAIGGFALQNNTNGNYNTANGFESLLWNTSGNYNTALGAYSLFSVGTGTNNIGIGYYAGLNITAGNNNIVIGNQGAFGDYNTIRIGDVQTNAVIAGVITGNGAGLTSLNASQLTSGAIPNSRLANSTITVTPGTGLSGGGAVALGGTVSLANSAVLTVGGSGVISSSGGQNPSISLTGVVPIANGGLGLSTGPATSGQYLRSAGGNTWAISALQSGDLPSGSMNYIQNQSASQQSGSFWISGTATAANFSGSGAGLTDMLKNSASTQAGNLSLSSSARVTLQANTFCTTNGTSWYGNGNFNAGVVGTCENASYNAGVVGIDFGTTTNSAGVVGSYSSSCWGALGYVDTNGIPWGGYFLGSVLATSFSGNGYSLTGLNANNITSGTLPLAQLPSSVVTLNEPGVTLGGLNVTNNIVLNDKELQLRSTADHGLGWYGPTKQFAGNSIDGPVLYGYGGGGLGIVHSGNSTNLVACWNSSGNVGIGTTSPTNRLHVVGGATFASGSAGANQVVVWTPGSASWSFTSDRNAKTGVQPVDTQAVLEKVAELPINEWNYIGYDQRHIGPMAQDFHAAFPLNESETSLNDADLHGVALAAIQGLNQKLQQKDSEIAELKVRMEKLERLLTQRNGGGQ